MIQTVPIGSLPECLACSCLQSEGLGGIPEVQGGLTLTTTTKIKLLVNQKYCTFFFPPHIFTSLQGNCPKGSVK